jgi:hypothetical protein
MKQISTMLYQLDKEIARLAMQIKQVKAERDKYKELYEGLQKKLLDVRLAGRKKIANNDVEFGIQDFREN